MNVREILRRRKEEKPCPKADLGHAIGILHTVLETTKKEQGLYKGSEVEDLQEEIDSLERAISILQGKHPEDVAEDGEEYPNVMSHLADEYDGPISPLCIRT